MSDFIGCCQTNVECPKEHELKVAEETENQQQLKENDTEIKK